VAKENSPSATATAPEGAGRDQSTKRKLIGVVVGDKMDKTRVVVVERRLAHSKYGKYMTRRTKYKAHDEKNEYHVGDRVEIIESRPLSREKRWRVQRLLERPQDV
jgi:small subunit ribosomal protein S17